MLSHEGVWAAIDALAERHGMTASALARAAGLDPTSFNKSKRMAGGGRLRWPSTESIAKALKATGTSIDDFMELMPSKGAGKHRKAKSRAMSPMPGAYSANQAWQVPLLGMAQAGVGGFFDDGGFPAGQGWDEVRFPTAEHDQVYALQVTGDSMLPLYRHGDVVIVAPGANVRKGDRVVARTRSGEVMAKILQRKSARGVELKSLNPDHPDRSLANEEIEWIARIIWASQ
ncbi:MAG: helix-turn-helix transcriptional regulator [Nitratireductor sp.]|nr:helix-turn-helix transcriptional regulator [Nitratireductor sp.]